MFQYQLNNPITGTVEQIHFDRKIYDTTDGRYNRGVFIVTEPGYYQFVSALAACTSYSGYIRWFLQHNGSSVARGLAKVISGSNQMI